MIMFLSSSDCSVGLLAMRVSKSVDVLMTLDCLLFFLTSLASGGVAVSASSILFSLEWSLSLEDDSKGAWTSEEVDESLDRLVGVEMDSSSDEKLEVEFNLCELEVAFECEDILDGVADLNSLDFLFDEEDEDEEEYEE
jgi:hypothetical protein